MVATKIPENELRSDKHRLSMEGGPDIDGILPEFITKYNYAITNPNSLLKEGDLSKLTLYIVLCELSTGIPGFDITRECVHIVNDSEQWLNGIRTMRVLIEEARKVIAAVSSNPSISVRSGYSSPSLTLPIQPFTPEKRFSLLDDASRIGKISTNADPIAMIKRNEIQPFDKQMIEFWKSKCTTVEDRAAWYNRMISMYDKDDGGGEGQYFRLDDYPQLHDFMRTTYSAQESFERINEESRLLYPATQSFGDVMHAAIWRVGGYSGGLNTRWYDPEKFTQVYENHPPSPGEPDMYSQAQLLLTDEDPNTQGADNAVRYALSPRIDRTYTFGILSPARVYRTDLSQSHWVHVLHVWGVNFESQRTQDWARIVTPITNAAGIVDEDRLRQAYHARMVELFSIIKKAIIETVDTVTAKYPHITTVHVRIPGIGLNNYLNGFRRQPLKDLCIL